MRIRKVPETHIEGFKELSIQGETFEYLSPKYVYLPMQFPSPLKELKSVGDKVLMGEAVLQREGRFAIPVLSPVSGTIKGVVKRWHHSNKMMNMLEIENDYKDTIIDDFKNLDPDKMDRHELVELMKSSGMVGMGGAGFPTYAKYETDKPVEQVIINFAECEPYITSDYTMVKLNPGLFIYGLKYLMKAAGTTKGVIAIKDKEINKPIIESLNKYLMDGMSIYLLHDVYPAGWEKYIVEKVTGKTYKMLPIEAGAIVSNATTCVTFAKLLKYGLPPSEKYVTFVGDSLKSNGNVLCKFGTNVTELLNLFGGLEENTDRSHTNFIAGGVMTGGAMFTEDFVTSATLGAVIVLRDKLYDRVTPHCLGCGTCALHCPVHLSPYEIKRAMKTGNIEMVKELEVNKCIQCGLCSYVCPSRIDLTTSIQMAKELVRRMG